MEMPPPENSYAVGVSGGLSIDKDRQIGWRPYTFRDEYPGSQKVRSFKKLS